MTGKIGKADKADVMTVGIRFSFFHALIPASLMGFLHQMQPGMLWKQGDCLFSNSLQKIRKNTVKN